MINNINFKKGDILIDFGKAYIVSGIKKQTTYDGKTEPFIIYKPFIQDWPDKSLICSIPLSSLASSNIRKPLNKNQVTKLLDLTANKLNISNEITVFKDEEILQTNDPVQIIKLLIKSWIPNKNPQSRSNKTKKKACIKAFEMLTNEIAIVYGITKDKAEQLLLNKLH